MKKSFFIFVFLIAAILTGFFASNILADQPEKMIHQDPVAMTEPFVINLADTDKSSYIKISVGFELKDISESEYKKLHPDSGGHGAPAATTSPLATDPVLRDSVITVVSRYTSTQLLTPQGKEKLRQDLLRQIHMKDPQSHVQDVLFTEMAIQ